MKLVCFNVSIHEDNGEKVIEFLRKGDYDIILLQEVLYGHEDSCFNLSKVGNMLDKEFKGEYNTAFAPIWIAKAQTINGEVVFDFGGRTEQGTMILTKNKLLRADNEFYYNEYKYEYDWTHFKERDWARSLQNSLVEIESNEVQVLNIHGYYSYDKIDKEQTIKQSEYILTRLEYDKPIILAGDFNVQPWTKSIKLINEKMTNLIDVYGIKATRPSFKNNLDRGDLVCDYIFVNDKIKVNSFKTIDTKLSDHFALELDFDIVK